jgi:small-conductance mechanosensitive channel
MLEDLSWEERAVFTEEFIEEYTEVTVTHGGGGSISLLWLILALLVTIAGRVVATLTPQKR